MFKSGAQWTVQDSEVSWTETLQAHKRVEYQTMVFRPKPTAQTYMVRIIIITVVVLIVYVKLIIF